MPLTRRKFLNIIGGGTIIGATGAGAFLATRTPTKALAPWSNAGEYAEPRRRALSYAILSPNPHNRQPWLVDLSHDGKIILFVDTTKMLPHTDPFNRQITIGLGCFLELLHMAAAQDGYRATITPFPEGHNTEQLDDRPVAEIQFTKDSTVQGDPLFAYALNRRSLKKPFDLSRPVPDSVLQGLHGVAENTASIGTTNDPQRVADIRALSGQAMMIETKTPRTYKESVDLFRIGKTKINANPDGIDFGGPLYDTLGMAGMFTRENALNTRSSLYQQGIDAVMENVNTAMGYVWLSTNTNTRLDQLNAGRDWLRINLATTQAGIGLHPISQLLQEYPEMTSHFALIHEMLGAQGKVVQMLGRLGYASVPAPSPRWGIEAKIIRT